MKIGLLIPTFNRPEYLVQCLEFVLKSNCSHELVILIIDDKSTDKLTINLIQKFEHPSFEVNKMFLLKNRGIAGVLRIGFNFLFGLGCQYVVNLDSDAIVKPNFIDVLVGLKTEFPDKIISGFNTQSVDPKTMKPRHQTIEQHADYCIKKTIGGINMLISETDYTQTVLPALTKPGHWDWNVCVRVFNFIVSTPSVVQHIGIRSGMNMNNPDIALDF
ncbi:MAG: N-glycosyltransferase [Bacteroidetes bacterium ADurb.BinA245]|nr:MAG: N-glycosyltransferase [Bacteroidetes bacterium ADurb.BinA245]